MTATFRMDEQVTIEQRTVARDPDFGGITAGDNDWEVVADHVWCYAQDILPGRSIESATQGLELAATRTRLRIQIDPRITASMRATLHGKGDRQMKVIAGPALLDDRRHVEFLLEGFSS